MEIGAQSMVKAILLQIPPPIQETVWVCSAYYSGCLMYAKHLFFHHLIISLLDLIQGSDHGIIVPLVAKCSLHVHQQVPHRDVFAFIQHAGPFTWVPTKTDEDVGVHTGLIILLQKGIHIKMPEHVHHLCPRIGQLEDQHIQSHWHHHHQPFSFPAPPMAPVPMPVAHCLTHSGVSIRVWHSSVWGGRGQTPSMDHSTLSLWQPSVRSHWVACGSHLSPFPNPRGPPILLRCTPHQLAQ